MPTQTAATDVVELNAVPVFRAGTYPQGTFDADYIQRLADAYDPQFHEAPNYLAHSDSSASDLAFGWVRRLYAKGATLFADFADVPRKFADLVLAGRIKKRSVEIYPDLGGKGPYLRAIAWPLVPEVKALADVHPTQVFSDETEKGVNKTKIIIVFQEEEPDMSDQVDPISRDELQLMCQQVTDELRAEVQKAFAELEVKNFCEQMLLAGKMTPAERDTEQPMLIGQRQRERSIQFEEGQRPLTDQRMEYYRNRTAVVALDDPGSSCTDRPDPAEQRLLQYFHENQEFFTRLGVTYDDLATAHKYETQPINPLAQGCN